MLLLLVVQDKIKKIVQTILMLLDVSLQKKAMSHLLKGMVIIRLQQRVMLLLLVVQDRKDRGLLLKVAEMNRLLVILNRLLVILNRLLVRNHLLKMMEMVEMNRLQVRHHLLNRLQVRHHLQDRLLVDRLLVDLKAYS